MCWGPGPGLKGCAHPGAVLPYDCFPRPLEHDTRSEYSSEVCLLTGMTLIFGGRARSDEGYIPLVVRLLPQIPWWCILFETGHRTGSGSRRIESLRVTSGVLMPVFYRHDWDEPDTSRESHVWFFVEMNDTEETYGGRRKDGWKVRQRYRIHQTHNHQDLASVRASPFLLSSNRVDPTTAIH